MQAHKVLQDAGYNVHSFGTGSVIKLPGPALDKPNIFEFGTDYDTIYEQLISQDPKLYQANGVLLMLERNRLIKKRAERWPYVNVASNLEYNSKHFNFDIVFTCEERCYDAVIEDLVNRNYNDPESTKRVIHIINLDIRDDHENAKVGGAGILKLADLISAKYKESLEVTNQYSEPFEDAMLDIMSLWQKEHPHLPLLYSVCYY